MKRDGGEKGGKKEGKILAPAGVQFPEQRGLVFPFGALEGGETNGERLR